MDIQRVKLENTVEDLDYELNPADYVTQGIPPDHVIDLPFATESSRGLDPEAMLKKMRELTEPDSERFNLHTKNCSKTCIAVLSAGAEQDPLLKQALGHEALGYLGTPQQVLSNAEDAINIIETNKQNTLLRKITGVNILNNAMGNLIDRYMQSNDPTTKNLLLVGIISIGILKTPEVLIRSIINPSKSMQYVTSAVNTLFKYADSTPLKILIGALSLVPLIFLSPFAFIEKGLKAVSSLWNNQKRFSSENSNLITVPLASGNKEIIENPDSYTKMAKLVDKHISQTIKNHTIEIARCKTPKEILVQFENDLEDNPDQVVVLDTEDFRRLNQYVLEKKDATLSSRFQQCCDQSLKRANKLSPHKPTDVDQIVKEINSSNQSEGMNIKVL